jgi:hypothetical protein
MPGATHVPLTVAQKSRRRVFYVGRPFGHYCPLKYAGAAQAQSPGEKGGRARLSGGRAPADTTSRAGAPLAAARLQCLQGGRVLGPCCKSKFVGVIWDRLSSPALIVVDRI